MPLETGTVLSDLNSSNPAHSDGLSQADAHLRLLKAVLLATFPNINAALSITDEQLNALAAGLMGFADGTAGAPSLHPTTDATIGLYKAAAGTLGLTGKLNVSGDVSLASALAVIGRITGNGAIDAGSMHQFPKVPPGGMASGGTATGSERYALTDGAVYNISTFPSLGAYLGSTFGGNGVTTFGMPDLVTAHRFIRAAGGSIAVGTAQADAIKTHSAALNGTAASHNHGISDPGHNHGVTGGTKGGTGSAFMGSGAGTVSNVVTGPADIAIAGNGTGITINNSGALALSGTADYSGDTETRPAAFAAYICLKT
jgi:microcystin-dependent protein